MLNSNLKIKKSVASALMSLVGLIIALNTCCCPSARATKGGEPPAGSSSVQNVFNMLRKKFPEVPFNTEEISSTCSEGTRPQDGSTPQDKKQPSTWESCCNVC